MKDQSMCLFSQKEHRHRLLSGLAIWQRSSIEMVSSGSERTAGAGGQLTDLGDGGGGSGLLVAAEGAEGLGGGGSGEEGKGSELHLSS